MSRFALLLDDGDGTLSKNVIKRLSSNCLSGLNVESGSTCRVIGFRSVAVLWAGMGHVYNVDLEISKQNNDASKISRSYVVKNICLPTSCRTADDKRKKDSYDVEVAFYECGHADALLHAGISCPKPLHIEKNLERITICMTSVRGSGCTLNHDGVRTALAWLAGLHALYWGSSRANEAVRNGLQPQGCFWYLDTRLDELESISDKGLEGRLRVAAIGLDERLKADQLQTICHGDSKSANMELSSDRQRIAMYDFQYCGKAPCTKDVAYCLFCAADRLDGDCTEQELLKFYHSSLCSKLDVLAAGASVPSFEQLWDSYVLAACDLARWMSGWGWWGHVKALRQRCEDTMDLIDGGHILESSIAYRERIFQQFPP